MYLQFVDDHIAVNQRQQLHIDNSPTYIGQRVALLFYQHTFQAQVEWETQVHTLDGDVHACLLGGYLGGLTYQPSLHRRHVDKQWQRQDGDDCYYSCDGNILQAFLHFQLSMSDCNWPHNGSGGNGASMSMGALLTGWMNDMRWLCREMLPSGLERLAPYFRSPFIGQPIAAN